MRGLLQRCGNHGNVGTNDSALNGSPDSVVDVFTPGALSPPGRI